MLQIEEQQFIWGYECGPGEKIINERREAGFQKGEQKNSDESKLKRTVILLATATSTTTQMGTIRKQGTRRRGDEAAS